VALGDGLERPGEHPGEVPAEDQVRLGGIDAPGLGGQLAQGLEGLGEALGDHALVEAGDESCGGAGHEARG